MRWPRLFPSRSALSSLAKTSSDLGTIQHKIGIKILWSLRCTEGGSQPFCIFEVVNHRRIQDIIAHLRVLAGSETLDSAAVEETIHSARENGSHQIVPSLLPFIFPKEEHRLHRFLKRKADGKVEVIQLTALRCVDQLLRNTSISHLPQLDGSIRATYGAYQSRPIGGWFEAHVTKVDKIECSAAERVTALGLLACHPSGFVREHALDVLGEENLAAAVPWAIIRANDWVANIRRAARKVLYKALQSDELESVAAAAPLLERLSLWGRDKHAELESALASALLTEQGQEVVREQLASPDAKVRRALARMSRQVDDASFAVLAEILVRDIDPGVRGVVARNLKRLGAKARSYEELLYGDRVATFNLLALESELSRDPDAAAARWPELVFHRSSTIRYLARHRLAELGNIEDSRLYFAKLYRAEALSESKRSIASLGGLAEVGEKSDVGILAPLLANPRSKLVRAALKCIKKLDPIQASDHLKAALGDARPGVRHDALRLLHAGLSESDLDLVLSIGRGDLAPSDPKHVLNLALQLPYWVGVEALLNIVADAGGELANLVIEYLLEVARHDHGHLPPKGESVRNLPQALATARGALPRELSQALLKLELPFGGGRPFLPIPSDTHRETVKFSTPIFLLLKLFSERRYAEMFQNGILRLNTLRYFRDWEDGQGNRGDRDEGNWGSFPQGGDFSIKIQFPDGREMNLDSNQAHTLRVQGNRDALANVYCLYAVRGEGSFQDLDEARRKLLVDTKAENLGPYLAVIKDVQAFVDRLTAALDDSYRREIAEVSYYDPSETRRFERPIFWKGNAYAHQKEIRVAVWREELVDEPLDLELGDLCDIVDLTTVEDFNSSIEVSFPGSP